MLVFLQLNCYEADEDSLPKIAQYGPPSVFELFYCFQRNQVIFSFALTAAGVVPYGGPIKSPRTLSIVQIIFLLLVLCDQWEYAENVIFMSKFCFVTQFRI